MSADDPTDRPTQDAMGVSPDQGPTVPPEGALVDAAEAARILEVPNDRIQVLVDQGMLEPAAHEPGLRFRVVDVEALRLLGA